jgi:hypothetical protein
MLANKDDLRAYTSSGAPLDMPHLQTQILDKPELTYNGLNRIFPEHQCGRNELFNVATW